MKKHVRFLPASVSLAFVASLLAYSTATVPAQELRATRLSQNPLITVDTSSSLGSNVNGPTVIRVPDWVERPLGRYYMYSRTTWGSSFDWPMQTRSPVRGSVDEPGVLHVRNTAFFRPQPDPKETLADFYTQWRPPKSCRSRAQATGDVVPRMVDEWRAMAQ